MKETNLYKKLLEIKKLVPHLEKEKAGYNYKYTSPESVLNTFNPLMNEAGIFLKTEVLEATPERVTVITKTGEKIETLYTLKMKFTFIDVDSDDILECLWCSSGCNGDEKGLGSALTYAERYFLLKTFNVSTGEDDPDARQEERGEQPRGTYKKSNDYEI
jgi:hypothetical protein